MNCKFFLLGVLLFCGIMIFVECLYGQEFWLGYDWKTTLDATLLSLQILMFAIVWTIIIHTTAIALCYSTTRWHRDIFEGIEIVFQIISSVPLFLLCIYVRSFGLTMVHAAWAGLILATGDFLLPAIFPMLHWNMQNRFTPTYRSALRGRGIFFPYPGMIFSYIHWKLFIKYYVRFYSLELLHIIENKIPLFFSALIIVEKAMFYGSNIQGANRGLGSLFLDAVLEWSEGLPRGVILLYLGSWCMILVSFTRLLLQYLAAYIQPKHN